MTTKTRPNCPWEPSVSCPECSPTGTTAGSDGGQQALLRCAVVHYLEDVAVRMADDHILLSEVLTGAVEYLNRVGRDGRSVLDKHLGPLLDAEIRLAVAYTAGLRPCGVLDPRIDDVIAKAASQPAPEQARLVGMAAFGYRLFMDAAR